MTRDEFNNLREGDIVRGKVIGDSTYIVTANYGGRVTAARTADLTNPAEWDVVGMRPKSLANQFRAGMSEIVAVQGRGGFSWPAGFDAEGFVINVREKLARRSEIWLDLHEEGSGAAWSVDRKTMIATRNPAAAAANADPAAAAANADPTAGAHCAEPLPAVGYVGLGIKAEEFVDALNDLCHEHKVQMSGHCPVYLRNLLPNEEPIDFPEIKDMT